MTQILQLIQIISGVLLIILVLVQQGTSDSGGLLGGESGGFLRTRRGAERFLFGLTVAIAIIFIATSVARIILA